MASTSIFQGTLLSDTVENDFHNGLKQLGVQFFRRKEVQYLTGATTHLIVGTKQARENGFMPRTERMLAAIASGKVWILSEDFVWAALSNFCQGLPKEVDFEYQTLAPFFHLVPFQTRRQQGGLFKGARIVIILNDNDCRYKYVNIVKAGEGEVVPWLLSRLETASDFEFQSLAMILIDPMLSHTAELLRFRDRLHTGTINCVIAAPAYLEEMLTTSAPVNWRRFDIWSPAMMGVHAEFDTSTNGIDLGVMGSPTIGVCPRALTQRLKLPPRVTAAAASSMAPPAMGQMRRQRVPSMDDNGYETQSTASTSMERESPSLSSQLENKFAVLNHGSPRDPRLMAPPRQQPPTDLKLVSWGRRKKQSPDPMFTSLGIKPISNPMDEMIRRSCVTAVQNDPVNTLAPILTNNNRRRFSLSEDAQDGIDACLQNIIPTQAAMTDRLTPCHKAVEARLEYVANKETKARSVVDAVAESMVSKILAESSDDLLKKRKKKKKKKKRKKDEVEVVVQVVDLASEEESSEDDYKPAAKRQMITLE